MQKELGNTLVYFLEANFLCFLRCQNLDVKFCHLSFSNLVRNYPKMCLVMVSICVPKGKTMQSNQKKWQAIEK